MRCTYIIKEIVLGRYKCGFSIHFSYELSHWILEKLGDIPHLFALLMSEYVGKLTFCVIKTPVSLCRYIFGFFFTRVRKNRHGDLQTELSVNSLNRPSTDDICCHRRKCRVRMLEIHL